MSDARIFVRKTNPLVYLITEGATTAKDFHSKKPEILQLIKSAVQTNVSLIQIREKHLPARLVFELASEAAKITARTRTKLLINDRADIALAAEADGVHLTAKSLSAQIIRSNFPKDFIIGASAHTIEKAEIAQAQGADFVTFSPIFDSPGKGAAQGIAKLQEVCCRLENFPVLALGGVDETNFTQILEAGASGIAAIRLFNNSHNLQSTIEKLTLTNR